jgi:isopenicillin N synthase-like dioxygenase
VDDVPVLNLEDHRSPDSTRRRDFGRQLRASLCDLGFVRVKNHGIDPRLIRSVYAEARGFFAQQESQKLCCSGVVAGQRGYTPRGVEHARDCDHPDLKEFFHIGQEPERLPDGADCADYPPNVWPEPRPGLRPGLRAGGVRLFRALEECAMELLEALADSFDLESDAFASMLVGGNSILRLLHYPPIPPGVASGPVRAAPHEDINLITLLCEATDAGLEIKPPGSDEWLRVQAPSGEIVVDSGDMLSRLTNGLIPATTHRVVSPPEVASRSRYSLPFFAHPRPECDLSVLPRFVAADRPCRYAPITAAGYLAERLREIGLVS